MMSKLIRRIRAFFQRSRLDRELDEEMQFHLAHLIAELRDQGYDAREARRRALIEFGAVNSLRDEARDAWGWRWLEVLLRDIGYGVRTLRKRPGFTFVAIVSLAIGIGANTAIFSIVNAVVLRELPYEHPEELVDVRLQLPDLLFPVLSYPDYEDVRDGASGGVFSEMIASQPALASIEDAAGEADVFGEVVSGNYFSALGVDAALGRLITPADDLERGAHPVVVLSYAYWQRQFGGDPHVVGTQLRVEGSSYTIVGVASPDYPGIMRGIIRPSIYAPLAMLDELVPGNLLEARDNHNLFVKGRLAPGVSLARAQAAVRSVAASLSETRPTGWDPAGTVVLARTTETLLSPDVDGGIRSVAWLLMVVVGLLLLVVCVNLAGFLMARALDRRREVAMRVALGASRAALVRQLLTETMLLSLLGGALGVSLALGLLNVLPSIDFGLPIPINTDVSPDMRVFAFMSGVCLLAGAFLGLVPALQGSRLDVATILRSESGGSSQPGRIRLRNGLVVAQLAVSVVLLVGTGLLLRSFERQRDMDPGFGQVSAAMINVEVPESLSAEEGRLYTRRLRERYAALPGVDAVGMINTLPLAAGRQWIDLLVDGHEPPPDQEVFHADYAIADSGYFESAGVAIVQGRAFDGRERADGERVAIVSAAMAESYWPSGDALGQVLHMVGGSPALPEPVADLRIVGVARDVAWESLGEPPRHLVYVPYSQFYSPFVSVLARTSADAEQTALALMSSGRMVDPGFTARQPTTMSRYLESQSHTAAIVAAVVASFSMLVLVLAAVGLYGVVSYALAARTREVGIRMALGADASAVRRLLTLGGIRLVAVAGLIGFALSVPVNRLLSTFLYGITAFDPASFAGAAAVLGTVALGAAYLPARRASRVNPVSALRTE